jgi:3-methyladenine DNA glycosylase Mpg
MNEKMEIHTMQTLNNKVITQGDMKSCKYLDFIRRKKERNIFQNAEKFSRSKREFPIFCL